MNQQLAERLDNVAKILTITQQSAHLKHDDG
jgi:hypothetical protein